ncbi:MAG: hypothetical protein ACYCW6_30970 [Candidatus Xenobia bacterium]
MAAQTSVTEQIMVVASQVQAGRVAPHLLQEKLDELESRLNAREQEFGDKVSGNAEYPPEAVEGMLAAFSQYREGLEMLRQEISNGGHAFDDGLAHIKHAGERLAAASQVHMQYVQQLGGTPFPAVNRLLLHLHLMREDPEEEPFLIAAVDDFSSFLRQASGRIEGALQARPDMLREGKHLLQAVEGLLANCRSVSPGDAGQIEYLQAKLRESAHALSTMMTSFADATMPGGPTPLTIINFVLRGITSVEQGTMSREQAVPALDAIQEELTRRWDGSGPAWAADAFESLLTSLRLLQTCLRQREPLGPAAQAVREAAYVLQAKVRSPAWTEDDEMFNYRDDIMGRSEAAAGQSGNVGYTNLQNLLDLGAACLQGQASGESLQTAVERMRLRVVRQRELISQSQDPMRHQFDAGARDMEEGLESLQQLAVSGDERCLEAARGLFLMAVDKLAPTLPPAG